MKKYIILLMFLLVSLGFSEQIAGTSVSLIAPEGYVISDRFPGFMKESTGSSIMVSEIDGPYVEVTAGFSDKRQMQARGMTLLEHLSVKVDGQQAMLLNVEQPAYGMLFRKWMLVVDRPNGTALIVATFPKSETRQGEDLKVAILASTFGIPSDPLDALAFVATPVAPFKVAKIMGQNMILSLNGQFPSDNEKSPIMILGLSTSTTPLASDQKAFADHRITQTATVKNVEITERSTPITIGELSGYMTMATAEGNDEAVPVTIYQVVLFDPSGYCMIQGITPSAKKVTYLPAFRKIAESFKLK